jgi:phosphoglycolate phosphatase-like HAD superfamily hydrolase
MAARPNCLLLTRLKSLRSRGSSVRRAPKAGQHPFAWYLPVCSRQAAGSAWLILRNHETMRVRARSSYLEAIIMFSGYIFDVEGTLVDSVPQNLLSLQEALGRFGLTVPYELLQLYSGLDGDQTLQLVAPDMHVEARKHVMAVQGKIYEAKYLASVKAFGGVRDVFEALAEKGGRIALATDCKGPELKHYLSLLKVDDLIDSLACGDDVEHGKPDPRLVGLALRKLEVPAAQAIMIGDTPYDAEAALGAGTLAAGLLTGGFAREALAGAGCFVVAKDLQDLLACLESGPRGIAALRA